MIVTARVLRERTRQAVCERIEKCEKRGGVSASLFLDTELNDALPRAKCLYFFGGKRNWKGLLSVFYPTEREAEFTAAVEEQHTSVLSALFRAALRECKRWGIEECHMVVNPAGGFRLPEGCGVQFIYSHSEYVLCCKAERLRLPTAERAEETAVRGILKKTEEQDGTLHYRLLADGAVVAECLAAPYEGRSGWYLYQLETREAFRRRGFATCLLREAAGELMVQGAEMLRLQVSSQNAPAERLYRRLGFWTGEQLDYYRIVEV